MTSAAMTFEKLRDDLPITREVAYFQVGSHGPTPDTVLDVVRDEMALEAHYHSVPSVKAAQAEREACARERVASFICAGSAEVALTPNTTQAMRQVSRSIGWREGDELLITSLEHVSTVSLGMGLTRQNGVRVQVVEADQGDAVFLESLKSALTDRTRLVCVSHVASPDGRILPVAAAAELAHDRGVPVVVDVAQSLGQFPVDVPALGCDFMVGSGHKWLMGPMGVGILWVAPDNLDEFMPDPLPDRKPWSIPGSPIPEPTAYDRAEGGTHNTAMAIGLGKAVEIVDELGTAAIASRVACLSRILRDEASRIGGVNVLTPTRPCGSAGITTLTFDGYTVEDLQALVSRIYEKYNALVKLQWLTAPLDVNRIGIRISIASFNNEDEVARLIDALKEGVAQFSGLGHRPALSLTKG
jgi:cysteine desulfurase/selenocysteine lyase